jgi:hypothetical protein
MIDDTTKFNILFQKSELLEKYRQRLFVILLILPILYSLIQVAVIQQIDFSIFTISQMKVIQYFMPSIYIVIIFYILVLTNHKSKLLDELTFIATNEREYSKAISKEPWLILINPLNFLGEVLGSIRAGRCIGLFGFLIVFLPFLLSTILYPIAFLIYGMHFNYKSIHEPNGIISLINLIFSIWMVLAVIIYSKSNLIEGELKNKSSR